MRDVNSTTRRGGWLTVAVIATAAVLLAACQPAGQVSTGAGAERGLLGAGATFPDPLYQEWIGAFIIDHPEVEITYEPIGSGGGVEQLIGQSVDFAGSDAFMTDAEIAAANEARGCQVLHIPTVFGAVAVAYNLPGTSDLTLDADTIAAIFLGEITTWSDAGIVALNPAVDLPATDIIVAHRSDGSGTTSIFTTYLDDESASWHDAVGKGKEVEWPTGVGGQGNDGVAAAIAQNEGGIGYVELSYALENELAVASVINADGIPVAPTLESTAAAADGIEIPDDLRFNILGVGGEGYPIAGATWVLAYACGYDAGTADALKSFLRESITTGDSIAADLHYAPISEALEEMALSNVERINVEP